VKGLDAGAYRLLVVERGGNEFIDVDRFDIERPAHMGAPGAQRLDHLVWSAKASKWVFTACG
jgi:hypothetical protein